MMTRDGLVSISGECQGSHAGGAHIQIFCLERSDEGI